MIVGTRLTQKVVHQQGDVLRTLAQGWQMQVDEVDAIEQILTEGMFAHHGAQVGIGGTHHTHVSTARLTVAQHLIGLVLQHAKQFHLTGQ